MATIEDTPCVGIMLVRKVYLDKTARLQMLIGQDRKHFVTIPKGEPKFGESDLDGAMRILEEKCGFAADEYNILQEFAFVMEDHVTGCDKVKYWVGFLKDADTPFVFGDDYDVGGWVDFKAIQNMMMVDLGKMKYNYGRQLQTFIKENHLGILDRINNRNIPF